MTTYTVSSGVISSGITLDSGDFLTVLSGGMASAISIDGGATELVSAGGVEIGTTVGADGDLIALPGANVWDNTVSSGGYVISTGVVVLAGSQLLLSARTIGYQDLEPGDEVLVLPGGVANGMSLNGGDMAVFIGGVASGISVFAGSMEVYSGGIASATALSGGEITIFAGGVADTTSLGEEGDMTVSCGGRANYTFVYPGGTLTVLSGGQIFETAISSGGIAVISSGGAASGGLVEEPGSDIEGNVSGSYLITHGVVVLNGANVVDESTTLSGATLNPGDQMLVLPGGTATGIIYSYLGAQDGVLVLPGGFTNGLSLINVGLIVYSGAEADDTFINDSSEMTISADGNADGIEADGGLIVAGGSAEDITLRGNERLIKGQADNTVVYGAFFVEGGEASGTAISGGYLTEDTGLSEDTQLFGGEALINGGTADGIDVRVGFVSLQGGTVSGIVLGSDGTESYEGGVVSGTVVSSGGTELVSGSQDIAPVVSTGGVEFVSSGGVVSSATLLGGYQALHGSAVGTEVDAGGVQTVFAGGVAIGTTIAAGGVVIVSAGGDVNGTTLLSGAFDIVSSGALGGDFDVQGGATLLILPDADVSYVQDDGGLVISTGVVVVSGNALLSAAATLSGNTVGSGLLEYVLSAGYAVDPSITAGGIVTDYAGVVSGATVLDARLILDGSAASTLRTTLDVGGVETVEQGLASGTVVSSGGTLALLGGTTQGATISSGGIETIAAGIASGSEINGGGIEIVSAGHEVDGVVYGGGVQIVDLAGVVSGVTLSGGVQTVYGSAVGTEVDDGGEQRVSAGGIVTDTTIDNGGSAVILGSGQASASILLSGALEIVSSGGVAYDVVAQSGSTLLILPGGQASGTQSAGGSVISANVIVMLGEQFVSAVAVLSGNTIGLSFQELVFGGGLAIDPVVIDWGSLTVSGGTVSSAAVLNDGILIISGGVAHATQISSGGSGFVKGGVARATHIGSGGSFVVEGGVASGTVVNNGGTDTVSAGREVDGVVHSGGEQIIEQAGVARSATITSGGIQTISESGLAVSTTVLSGGRANIADGGSATSTTLLAGALEVVSSGGTASAIDVESGATLIILPGGKISSVQGDGAVISSGVVVLSGTDLVSASAVLTGNAVGSNLRELVLGSGEAINPTVVAGGDVTVFAGSLSGGTVDNGGTATLDGGQDVGTTVANGGTLSVTWGAAIAAQVTSAGIVNVSSGGNIVDPVVGSGGSVLVLSGGAETLSAGNVGDGTVINAGGTLLLAGLVISDGSAFTAGQVGGTSVINGAEVISGGYADTVAAVVLSGGIESVAVGGLASETIVSSGGREDVATSVIYSYATVMNDLVIEYEYYAGGASDTELQTGGSELVEYNPIAGTQFTSASISDDGISIETDISGGEIGNYRINFDQSLLDTTDEAVITWPSAPPEGVLFTLGDGPCFCRHTAVTTEYGEVAVENLRIGDCLITHASKTRPIRWIGRRSYSGLFIAGNRDVMPVMFHAGALADGVPRRDLFVSPLHAMFLDGVLIPARHLVNGVSIVQLKTVDHLDYFHLELDTHDVILAEGAPTETFVDCDSRAMFQNAHEFAAMYPDDVAPGWKFCAERVVDGRLLATVRRRLAARAGLAADHVDDAASEGPLDGRIDFLDHGSLAGWAFDATRPRTPVPIEIVVDGRAVATAVANSFRADLRAAGKGDGQCAFDIRLDAQLSPQTGHHVQVRRQSDGALLTEIVVKLSADPRVPGPLEGRIDAADSAGVAGWAIDRDWPDIPVRLEIVEDGRVIGCTLAARYRPDLAQADLAEGRCSFSFRFDVNAPPRAPHLVQVRRAADQAALPGMALAASRPPALFIGHSVPTLATDACSQVVLSHMQGMLRLG